MANFVIKVNNNACKVDVESETPLLWVFRDHIGLTGTKYGCGIAQCGACTIHIDGIAKQSCSAPVSGPSRRGYAWEYPCWSLVSLSRTTSFHSRSKIIDKRKIQGRISILHQGSINVTGASCLFQPALLLVCTYWVQLSFPF